MNPRAIPTSAPPRDGPRRGEGTAFGPPALAPAVRRSAGLPVSAPVEVRATHASWVFLAGQHVWKVKRPVDLGFLDFRALEDRQRCCEEEIRLNRRLAPDVYLGVEAVRATPRGLV